MLSHSNRSAGRTALAGLLLLLLSVISQGAMAHCKGKHQTDWPSDGSHDYCESGSGGGDGDSGADVKMICVLDHGGANNVLPDRIAGAEWTEEDTWYVDGLEKVACDTGGTSQPNLSGINLSSFSGGNQKQIQRYLNFEFDFCNDRDFCIEGDSHHGGTINGYPFTGAEGLDNLMGFFRHEEASNFENNVFENASIAVRPYKSDNNGGAPTDQDHIQLLEPRDYLMAVRLILRDYSKNTPRVVVSLAGHSVLGDKFQGVLCDIPDQTPAITQDATVTVYETGSIPRFRVSADYYGALCTNIPWDQDQDPSTEPESCGTGAEASRLCNFHGLVKVKFTMDAIAIQ
jgi:hypothetical protein